MRYGNVRRPPGRDVAGRAETRSRAAGKATIARTTSLPSVNESGLDGGPYRPGSLVPFTIRAECLKKAGMMTTTCSCPSQSSLPHAPPVRSRRTSLMLAEAARQRRHECRQRRQNRIRRASWFDLFDRRPFDSVRTQATPGIVFAGATPLVYTLPLF
jgi:hypothetical protein